MRCAFVPVKEETAPSLMGIFPGTSGIDPDVSSLHIGPVQFFCCFVSHFVIRHFNETETLYPLIGVLYCTIFQAAQMM